MTIFNILLKSIFLVILKKRLFMNKNVFCYLVIISIFQFTHSSENQEQIAQEIKENPTDKLLPLLRVATSIRNHNAFIKLRTIYGVDRVDNWRPDPVDHALIDGLLYACETGGIQELKELIISRSVLFELFTEKDFEKLLSIISENRTKMIEQENSESYMSLLRALNKHINIPEELQEDFLKLVEENKRDKEEKRDKIFSECKKEISDAFENSSNEKALRDKIDTMFFKYKDNPIFNDGDEKEGEKRFADFLVQFFIDRFDATGAGNGIEEKEKFLSKYGTFFVYRYSKRNLWSESVEESIKDKIGTDLTSKSKEDQLQAIIEGKDFKALTFYVAVKSSQIKISNPKKNVSYKDSIYSSPPSDDECFYSFCEILASLKLDPNFAGTNDCNRLLIDTCGKFIQSKFVAKNPELWKKLMDAASDTIKTIAERNPKEGPKIPRTLSMQMEYFFEKTFACTVKDLTDKSDLFGRLSLGDYFPSTVTEKRVPRVYGTLMSYNNHQTLAEDVIVKVDRAKYLDTKASIRKKLELFGFKKIGWIQRKFDFVRSVCKGFYFNKTDGQRYKSAMSITDSFKKLLDNTKIPSIGMSEKDIQSFLRDISILLRSLKLVSSVEGQPRELLQTLLELKPFQNDDKKWKSFIEEHLFSRAADGKQGAFFELCKSTLRTLVTEQSDESLTIHTQEPPRGLDVHNDSSEIKPTTEGKTPEKLRSGSGAQRPRTGSQSSLVSAEEQRRLNEELRKQREEAAAQEHGHVGGELLVKGKPGRRA